jgi:sec-independent protein translocase protein TatC
MSSMETAEIDDESSILEEAIRAFWKRLGEIRWRLFKILLAVVIGTIIGFIFRQYVVDLLSSPLPLVTSTLATQAHGKLVVMGITEGFMVYLKVSLATGVLLALPVILYQVWAFIAPALKSKGARYAVAFVLFGILLFVIGALLGYLVLRYPVQWLIFFSVANFTPLITADSYFTFAVWFVVCFGLVFELPLVLLFLARFGVINATGLRKKRAFVHLGMWATCAIVPVLPDIYSPIILSIALSILYEGTILVIAIMEKRAAIAGGANEPSV